MIFTFCGEGMPIDIGAYNTAYTFENSNIIFENTVAYRGLLSRRVLKMLTSLLQNACLSLKS